LLPIIFARFGSGILSIGRGLDFFGGSQAALQLAKFERTNASALSNPAPETVR
jgi:hypothetical protein